MSTNEKFRVNRVIIDYTPAQLSAGKVWYVYFYAKHPEIGILKRVRVKVNRIKNKIERKKFANTVIDNINTKLRSGWNPFVEEQCPNAYKKLKEVIDTYITITNKNLENKVIRKSTYDGYISYIHNINEFLKEKKLEHIFVYQFDKTIINKILDWIYLEKNRGAKTRDNYLAFLRIFSAFLVEKEFLKVKPTDGVAVIGKKIIVDKNRSVIDKDCLQKVFNYLENYNKPYLMACYFTYYGFIRPNEMSYLQVKHINLDNKTILIPANISKNKKAATITIPLKLFELINDLKICSHDPDNYIFSENFLPGPKKRSEKAYRDYWQKVKSRFNLPAEYKFYSLKDTGITEMLSIVGDTRKVRDQARHHSIAMTDNYTPHNRMRGDHTIAELDY